VLDLPGTSLGSDKNAYKDSNLSEPVVLDFSSGVTDVTVGMPLEIALSRHSDALLVQADIPLYIASFEGLLTEFEKLIPAVEDAGPGVAYIDFNGLDRLYGTAGEVIRRLAATSGSFDLRIGIGESKWQAYLASLVSSSHSARKISGDPARFVGNFTTEYLPVSFKIIDRLHRFGLHTLADIAKLPQGPVEAQFGVTGRLIWNLANGVDDRPLLPRKLIESVSESLTFPDPTVSIMTIVSAIESLLGRAFAKPQMARRFARRARLQAQVFSKPPWVMEVAFKEPAGSKNRAMFGIKAKIDDIEFPGPLEDLHLTLTDLSAEPWRQESMWKEVQQEDNLQQAVAQLTARLGLAPPIYQVKELEPWSRIPERRHALVQLSH
jgi:DNA polymerase-4/protein ImuB